VIVVAGSPFVPAHRGRPARWRPPSIWFLETDEDGDSPAELTFDELAFETIEEWMTALEASPGSSPGDVRPASAADGCFDVDGDLPRAVVPDAVEAIGGPALVQVTGAEAGASIEVRQDGVVVAELDADTSGAGTLVGLEEGTYVVAPRVGVTVDCCRPR
jgi:hypothetical protein